MMTKMAQDITFLHMPKKPKCYICLTTDDIRFCCLKHDIEIQKLMKVMIGAYQEVSNKYGKAIKKNKKKKIYSL